MGVLFSENRATDWGGKTEEPGSAAKRTCGMKEWNCAGDYRRIACHY